MNGFSEAQILEIRSGKAGFDVKLDALVKFVKDLTLQRGKPSAEAVQTLLAAGYTQANIIDIIIVVGDKIISNFLNGVAETPIDFPVAAALDEVYA